MEDAAVGAQGDLAELLTTTLDRAKTILDAAGTFTPFALGVQADGTVRPVTVEHTIEAIQASDVLVLTKNALRSQRADFVAASIAIDVKLPNEDTDDIRVRLEHRDGNAIAASLPYRRSDFGGELKFGDVRTTSIDPEIW